MPRPNTRLKSLRELVPLSQAELAERVGVAEITIRRWEAGLRPQPEHVRRLCAVFDASPAQLGLAPENDSKESGRLARVLREAADEAAEFTRRAQTSSAGPAMLEHLEQVVIRISDAYAREAPSDLFGIARTYRQRVDQLIAGPTTLPESRELFVFAGWLSEMLAWLTHDLGDPVAADAYCNDAWEHADQTGHTELCAWAMDAKASIGLYARRPDRALAAALRGLSAVPTGHHIYSKLKPCSKDCQPEARLCSA